MTRSKKIPDVAVPPHVTHHYAQKVLELKRNGVTQKELGRQIGVEQSSISKLLSVLKGNEYLPGSEFIWKLSNYFHEPFWQAMGGTVPAEQVDDMLPNRGRALAILGEDSKEYPADLVGALRKQRPPVGHERWTHVLWLRHFERTRKAWEDGLIDLPGVNKR